MWFFLVIYGVFIVGIPALWLWVWRGKFLHKQLNETRLETHRGQVARSVKKMFPVWLLMVLGEADTVISINPISHDFRLIWLGFHAASLLFAVGLVAVNFVALVREEQENRRIRALR